MHSENKHFLKQLYEKDKLKTKEILSNVHKDKQNINKQPLTKPNLDKKMKKIKTESSEQMSLSVIHQKQLYLDLSQFQRNQEDIPQIFGAEWLNLGDDIYKFEKVFLHGKEWQSIIGDKIENEIIKSQTRKCIIIEVNCIGSQNVFSNILIKYGLNLLRFGKCSWSVAAITSSKMFDLLSLQTQGSLLWKSKTPLSKVFLEKESIMKRIFGFSIQKEKTIGIHETLAKMVFPNNNIVYFILKNPNFPLSQPSSKLLVEQQTIIETITEVQRYKIIFCQSSINPKTQLLKHLQKLAVKPKKLQKLSKEQKEKYLKGMIERLQSQLSTKQKELLYYQSNSVIQQDLCIPSQRISMHEKYGQLQRSIKYIQSIQGFRQ